jgi:hypothetical protein
MSKKQEMNELMGLLVKSIHSRSSRYHYKLTGDEPECLSCLIDLDEAGTHHLLHQLGLLDEKTKKYKMSGVVDQHDMYAPCTILNFARSTYSIEKKKNVKNKEFYLTVGKINNEIRLPSNQYGLVMSPDDENKKKKIHVLEILPPTIRLSKDEKEMAEKLKVLVYNSMPMTVRRNQLHQSGKKASVEAPQPSSAMTAEPTSSLAKKTLQQLTPLPLLGFRSRASWSRFRSRLLAL